MTSIVLSHEEYEAAIHKNQTWNLWANVLDITFFNLALSFIYGTTILPLYVSHLTTSAVLIGLIPAIQSVGYFLPQLLAAQRSEQLRRQKPFIQKVSVMERLPYLFVALACLLWPSAPPGISYVILAASLALATFSGGVAGPAWNHMLSKVIPLKRRGFFFGLASATGGMAGVGGAALSRHFLGNYAFPISFGLCFLFCFIAQVFSWTALSLNREPPRQPQVKALPARDYWRRLPDVLRRDPNFRRYLIARSLIILGGMATALYIVYGRRAFAVTDAFAANLTMAALITQTTVTPLLGMLADRRGNKLLSEICALFGAGALVLVLMAPESLWFYPAFILMNGAMSGIFVAGQGIHMEFGGQANLPTYVALANSLLALPILIAPILGGWLADTLGFHNLFAVALVFSLAGWATMRWGVRDPRHWRVAE